MNQSLGVIIEGGFILLVTLALLIVVTAVVKHIYKQIKKNRKTFLKDNSVSKALKPLRTMIVLVGLSYIAYIFVVRLQQENNFESSFTQFRNLVIILCATWFCYELKNQLLYTWVKKSQYGGSTVEKGKEVLLSKLITITLFIVSGLIILDSFGVHIGALLALGGVGGIAVGFAAKDVFANFFSGFMLHVTRPFKIGDMIHTLDHKMEGKVEHIGFYLTRIKGTDRRPFYVPNSMFSSQVTVNASRMTNRRIKKTIGIRYDDFNQIKPIIKDIQALLKKHPDIDDNDLQQVNFIEFGDFSLQIQIWAFTISTSVVGMLKTQEEILLEVGDIVEKHRAEMAFPTSTLHINELSSKDTN